MNYAELFFASLGSLNEFIYPRAVIRYQREIIEQSSFSLTSPWTGRALRPTACHLSNLGDPAHGNLGIAYRFDGDAPFWLLANSVKDGFPITEAYVPSMGTSLWCRNDVHSQENKSWKQVLFALEQDGINASHLVSQHGSSVVLMGHPNFAHNLWNELSALHFYSQSRPAASSALEFQVLYEPLVSLTDITGDIPVKVTRPKSFQSLVGFQPSLVTRLGSTQIPLVFRQQLTSLLTVRRDETLTDELVTSLAGSGPVIWISARLDARTLDNQSEFLHSLITRIADHYPRAAFIMDGFSYANDYGSKVYLQGDGGPSGAQREGSGLGGVMRLREKEVTAYITGLQDKLGAHLANTIINVSGMQLAEAIYFAGLAQYYVCHAGTLQHKIAWLHNTPGMVHSNTTGLVKGASAWLADQLEGGLSPGLISPEHVVDLDSIRTTNQVDRNRDYHLLDIDGAVADILKDLSRHASS